MIYINSFSKILEFDLSDLIIGFLTYFTFERVWILLIEKIVIKIEEKIANIPINIISNKKK